MSEQKSTKTKFIKIITTLFIVGLLIHVADIFYDRQSGEVALNECGDGNVKSVSTKGYFKRDISCIGGDQ